MAALIKNKKKKSQRRKQNNEVIVTKTVITINYLASRSKQKSLWNCENLRPGPSCDKVGQIYSNKMRGAVISTLPDFFSSVMQFKECTLLK